MFDYLDHIFGVILGALTILGIIGGFFAWMVRYVVKPDIGKRVTQSMKDVLEIVDANRHETEQSLATIAAREQTCRAHMESLVDKAERRSDEKIDRISGEIGVVRSEIGEVRKDTRMLVANLLHDGRRDNDHV